MRIFKSARNDTEPSTITSAPNVSPRSNRPMSARTKRATGKAILSDSQFLVPFVVLLAGIVLLVVLH